jgi:APA family basic amino acid/polyamine antiporter
MGQQGPGLRGQLGFVDTTAIALGAVIGAGIFVVLGEGARFAGGALPVAIVIAAVVASFSGLSAAELGVSYPRVGGAYEFGYQLLWPAVGFSAGLAYLLGLVTTGGALTLTFAAYLQPLFPGLPLRPVAVGLALAALAVNAAGVQQSRRVNNVLVAFKVGVLVVFVAVGLAFLGNWQPIQPAPELAGLTSASGLLFFAFTGFARPVTLVEEVRDPARNLPRSIMTALALATGLYLAVAVVALGLLGAPRLGASADPLRAALVPTGLTWAQALLSVGGLVATADVLLTGIWGLSRMLFAMARRGDLPPVLSRLTPGGVPRYAVLAAGAIVALLSAFAAFELVIAASSLSLLVYYAVTNWAALRLRPSQRLYPALVPLAGLVSTVALALSLPAQALLVVAGVLGAGLLYFFLWHRSGRASPPPGPG